MTTATKDYEVIDRNGKRVRRTGILEDGDRLNVPMSCMDSANSLAMASAQLEDHQLSTFAQAYNGGMSLTDAMSKAKAIKRVEQFDARGHLPGFVTGIGDTYSAAEAARDARIKHTCDAYKNPAPVLTQDARHVERHHTPLVPVTAPKDQLVAARDKVLADRDQRTEAAWQRT